MEDNDDGMVDSDGIDTLGVHERFLLEQVHGNNVLEWDAKQRFIAMFIFRAHCKRDVFECVQVHTNTTSRKTRSLTKTCAE